MTSNRVFKLFFLVCVLLLLNGCLVTPLKPDKTVSGYQATSTVVVVPSTVHIDGNVIPAGVYLPWKQTSESVYYSSEHLVTTHGFTVPRAKRHGGVRISEREGKLFASLWYWEGGYSGNLSLNESGIRLFRTNDRRQITDLIAQFGETPAATLEGEPGDVAAKPVVRLVIKDIADDAYHPAFDAMIYEGFVDSKVFSAIRGESEDADNTVVVLFKGTYDEEKHSDTNMWITAFSGGLIPFKQSWNYSMIITIKTKSQRSRQFTYEGTTAEFVNILSDAESMHRTAVHAMLDRFFKELQEDPVFDSMLGEAI